MLKYSEIVENYTTVSEYWQECAEKFTNGLHSSLFERLVVRLRIVSKYVMVIKNMILVIDFRLYKTEVTAWDGIVNSLAEENR